MSKKWSAGRKGVEGRDGVSKRNVRDGGGDRVDAKGRWAKREKEGGLVDNCCQRGVVGNRWGAVALGVLWGFCG